MWAFIVIVVFIIIIIVLLLFNIMMLLLMIYCYYCRSGCLRIYTRHARARAVCVCKLLCGACVAACSIEEEHGLTMLTPTMDR